MSYKKLTNAKDDDCDFENTKSANSGSNGREGGGGGSTKATRFGVKITPKRVKSVIINSMGSSTNGTVPPVVNECADRVDGDTNNNNKNKNNNNNKSIMTKSQKNNHTRCRSRSWSMLIGKLNQQFGSEEKLNDYFYADNNDVISKASGTIQYDITSD